MGNSDTAPHFMEYQHNYVMKSRSVQSRENFYSLYFVFQASFSSSRRTERLTKTCKIIVLIFVT